MMVQWYAARPPCTPKEQADIEYRTYDTLIPRDVGELGMLRGRAIALIRTAAGRVSSYLRPELLQTVAGNF